MDCKSLRSNKVAKKQKQKKTYQQSSCSSSFPALGWCCECYRWRTYCCWACLLMWLLHTWYNCPSPSCPGSWILRECIQIQSHAESEKEIKNNHRLKEEGQSVCTSLIHSFSLCRNGLRLSNSPGSQSCVLLHVQKWYGRLLEVRGRHSSVRWLYQYWETSFFHLSTACFFHRCLQSSLKKKKNQIKQIKQVGTNVLPTHSKTWRILLIKEGRKCNEHADNYSINTDDKCDLSVYGSCKIKNFHCHHKEKINNLCTINDVS